MKQARLHLWLLFDVFFWLCPSTCAQEFEIGDLAIQEALGLEIGEEDCSIFGEGGCQDQSLLQTKALYNKARENMVLSPSETVSFADRGKTETELSPLSFFQMGEEVSVGEVRMNGSSVGESNSPVGEVHMQTDAAQEMRLVAAIRDEAGATASAPVLSDVSHTSQASLRSKPVEKWQAAAFDVFPGHSSKQLTEEVDRSSSSQTSLINLMYGHPLAALAAFTITFVLAALSGWTVGMAILRCRSPARSLPKDKSSATSVPRDAVQAQAPFVKTEDDSFDVLSTPPPQVMKLEGCGRSPSPCAQVVADDAIVWCTPENLEELLPSVGGYDCDFAKPRTTGKPVRLKVRIEGPLPGGPGPLGLVKAPFTQRNCVHYAAGAKQVRGRDDEMLNRQAKDGVDFQVSLVGSPGVTIDVLSHEVKLTGKLCASHTTTACHSFDSAPGLWQDFFLQATAEHSLVQQPNLQKEELRGVIFEFQERVLLVGSQVVIVGELVRDASGHLFIQPWRSNFTPAEESWRTSWERLEASSCESNVLVSYL